MPFYKFAQPARMLETFGFRKSNSTAAIKIITRKTRCEVNMIMPDILIACRFIVLPCRNSITVVNVFHGKRNCPRHFVDIRHIFDRQVKYIFKMTIGDNQQVYGVLSPSAKRKESRHCL